MTLQLVVQRCCGCLIHESVQDQVGWASGQPDLVEDVPALGRAGVELDDLSLASQIILCFYFQKNKVTFHGWRWPILQQLECRPMWLQLLNFQKAHFVIGTLENDCVHICYWTCFSNFLGIGGPARGFVINLTCIVKNISFFFPLF